MLSGFREFIMRGNVVDLAVAVVIGASFGAVVASFVADVLTPLLGIFGSPNFEELAFSVGTAEVRYGPFLNALLAFLLLAAAIYFFVVAPMNALEARRQAGTERRPRRRPAPSAPPRSRSPPVAAPCARSRSSERPAQSACRPILGNNGHTLADLARSWDKQPGGRPHLAVRATRETAPATMWPILPTAS